MAGRIGFNDNTGTGSGIAEDGIISLGSRALMAITTNITSWQSGTTNQNLAKVVDGDKMTSLYALNALNKYIEFTMNDVEILIIDKIDFYNRLNGGTGQADRWINNARIDYYLRGSIVATETMTTPSESTYTAGHGLEVDVVRITFVSNQKQNFREIEIHGTVSLKGEKGDTGDTGPVGPAGASIEFKGTYNHATTYRHGDLVRYNGITYHCNIISATAVVPDAPPQNGITTWTIIVEDGTDIEEHTGNLALGHRTLMAVTTNVTSWHAGTTAENLVRIVDGVTSTTGAFNYEVAPEGANGKYISFKLTTGGVFLLDRVEFFNRADAGTASERITSSLVEYLRDGVVLRNDVMTGGNKTTYTSGGGLYVDEVRIVFNGNLQNFREIEVFGTIPNGATGATGTAGTNGTNGTDGTDGTNGTNGTDGTDGTNGTNGTNGANGAKGDDGAVGARGEKGADGASSAKGDTGPKGADGTNGTDGTDGTSIFYKGVYVHTTTYRQGELVRYNGKVYYCNIISSTGTVPDAPPQNNVINWILAVEDGATGADGADGTDGTDGTSVTTVDGNLALASRNLMTVTTNVTSYIVGTPASNFAAINDGVTSTSGNLNYACTPSNANGKYIEFKLTDGEVFKFDRLVFFNRAGSSASTRIAGSTLEYRRAGTVLATETMTSLNESTYTNARGHWLDTVRLVFSGNDQNFREIEVYGLIPHGTSGATGPAGPIGLTGPAGVKGDDGDSVEFKGVYNHSVTYRHGELVRYEGKVYHCNIISSTGTIPSAPPQNNVNNWTVVVEDGVDGTSGLTEGNLALSSKNLMALTTNITSWGSGTTATNLANVVDGNTSTSFSATNAQNKWIEFKLKGNEVIIIDYIKIFNTLDHSKESQIVGSSIDCYLGSTNVSSELMVLADQSAYIDARGKEVDRIIITFLTDQNQDFRELEIHGALSLKGPAGPGRDFYQSNGSHINTSSLRFADTDAKRSGITYNDDQNRFTVSKTATYSIMYSGSIKNTAESWLRIYPEGNAHKDTFLQHMLEHIDNVATIYNISIPTSTTFKSRVFQFDGIALKAGSSFSVRINDGTHHLNRSDRGLDYSYISITEQ